MLEKVDPHTKQSLMAFDNINELFSLLSADVSASFEMQIRYPDDQFLRRNAVRTAWAFIEGVTFGFKHWLLTICDLAKEPLTRSERTLLTEMIFKMNEKGEFKQFPIRERTNSNIGKVFKLLGKKLDMNWSPDFNDKNWCAMRDSLKVRHRVTHPKRSQDLTISYDEMQKVNSSMKWMFKTFAEFSEKPLAKIDEYKSE